jgi:hypothetical protein
MQSSSSYEVTSFQPSTKDSLRLTFRDIRDLCRFPKPRRDLVALAKALPYWLQLFRSSPVIAFLVARCWHFDGQPEEGAGLRISRYVQMKRSAICESMGFPSDPRTVRLISRMHINPMLVQNLLLLRELLRWEPATRDILDRSRHVSVRDLTEVAIGNRRSEFASWENIHQAAWFFKLPAAKRYWMAEHYFEGCRPRELDHLFLEPPRPLDWFRSERRAVSWIVSYQQRSLSIWLAKQKLNVNGFGWPAPPIPPAPSINPVLSAEALEAEGKQLSHCVATYVERVLLGNYYVYRVEGSVRSTLGIKYGNGSWIIDQLKGERNAEPPAEVFMLVNDWLLSAPTQKRDTSMRQAYLDAISELSGLPLLKRLK